MAIDHIIDFVCPPKEALTVDGILQRLKANARAEQMVTLHREAGDARPVTEIQYQLSFRTPEDKDETRLVYAQEELDFAAELNAWASHCVGCPANRAGTAYGCIGAINYPIPLEAEEWLLKQLPLPAQAPLVWLLMKQGIEEFNYNGSQRAAAARGGCVLRGGHTTVASAGRVSHRRQPGIRDAVQRRPSQP